MINRSKLTKKEMKKTLVYSILSVIMLSFASCDSLVKKILNEDEDEPDVPSTTVPTIDSMKRETSRIKVSKMMNGIISLWSRNMTINGLLHHPCI